MAGITIIVRAIIKATIFAGIVSTILFWKMGTTALFAVAMSCTAMELITSWLLLMYAKRGYMARLNDLRERLVRERTLEKRVMGDHSVDPIEQDDVDVLVATIHRKTFDELPFPIWAITCRQEIEEYQKLYESSPGADPQSQPMWLVLLNTLFLLACPILLAVAIALHFKS